MEAELNTLSWGNPRRLPEEAVFLTAPEGRESRWRKDSVNTADTAELV